jgi:two-component system sensor histidine kinase PilS (NtrC family)
MIRVILFSLLLAVTALLQSMGLRVIMPPTTVTLAFLAVVFIYSIGCAALLQNKKRHLQRFGLIQLLSDTVFAALLVLGTGCSQSIFIAVFIFPIISGGLILYRIGGLIPASAATILLGILLSFEYFGHVPAFYALTKYRELHNPLALTNIFAVYGITFFTAALLSGILAGRLRSAEEELSRTTLEYDRLSQLYKQIFDDITTGIITVNEQNLVTSYNRAAEKITDFPAKEVIGRPFENFFPSINLTVEHHERPVADLRKKNGDMIRVGYSFARLNLVDDDTEKEDHCENCKVITLQDISRVEKMEQQMREAEKMAAIGELSAAVAHDFRNPLAAISGSAQMLAMDIGASTDATDTSRSLADIIVRESNRMARTITEFLQFARPTAIAPEWFDLGRLVRETVEQLCGANSRFQECRIDIHIPDRMDCLADRQQIQTILLHLLENSCVASSQTTEPITIRAHEEERQGRNTICITITDHGPGIDESVREQIFTPFFSTRADSTGLGLPIVKQLLEHHKGTITFPYPEHGGCIVEITLPLPSTAQPATGTEDN